MEQPVGAPQPGDMEHKAAASGSTPPSGGSAAPEDDLLASLGIKMGKASLSVPEPANDTAPEETLPLNKEEKLSLMSAEEVLVEKQSSSVSHKPAGDDSRMSPSRLMSVSETAEEPPREEKEEEDSPEPDLGAPLMEIKPIVEPTKTEEKVLDKFTVLSPFELGDDEEETETFHQLDLGPLLKKKDVMSAFDILSPDELEEEEEFISKALPNGSLIRQRYKVMKVLGEKRGHVSYVVEDTYADDPEVKSAGKTKTFIVKEIQPEEMSKEELRDRRNRYMDHIRIINTFKHSNLSEVYDGFSENGREYSLMQRVEGLNLRKLAGMTAKPFPEKDVVKWGLELCDAVEFMHYRPTPFTIGDLKPSNVMAALGGTLKIVDYDLQRFFDVNRNLDFAPDNPTKLFGDITKLGRILYFLLTKKDYDTRAHDVEWPEHVSKKMRRFLETVCKDGQQSYGDIKAFKVKLADTQVEDAEDQQSQRRRYGFPIHKLDFSFLRKGLEAVLSQRPAFLAIEAALLAFVIIFMLASNASTRVTYQRIKGDVMYVYTNNDVLCIEPVTCSTVFRKTMPGKVSVVYPCRLTVQTKKQKTLVDAPVILVGYSDRHDLDVFLSSNLEQVDQVRCNKGAIKIVPAPGTTKLYVLHNAGGLVSVVDLPAKKAVRVLSVGIAPIDLAYIPLDEAGAQKRAEMLKNQPASAPATPSPAPGAPSGEVRANPFFVPTSSIGIRPGGPKTIQGENIPAPLLAVSDPQSGLVYFYDAETGNERTKLFMDGVPGTVAFSENPRLVYVLDTQKNGVWGIDTSALLVSKSLAFTGKAPVSMALDPATSSLWVLCKNDKDNNELVSVDVNLSAEKGTTLLGGRVPRQVFFDSVRNKLWVLQNLEVSVYDPGVADSKKRISIAQPPLGIALEKE